MAKAKLNDAEQVALYMQDLEHPLKAEIELIRAIIKTANAKIQERIKWNAPSYFYIEDLVTFGPPSRKSDEVMLVFHHPFIVQVSSDILVGDYKDRRLAHFKNSTEIETKKAEIQRVINEIINAIDNTENFGEVFFK